MSKLFNDTRIYLKDSDKVLLADCRARIMVLCSNGSDILHDSRALQEDDQ